MNENLHAQKAASNHVGEMDSSAWGVKDLGMTIRHIVLPSMQIR